MWKKKLISSLLKTNKPSEMYRRSRCSCKKWKTGKVVKVYIILINLTDSTKCVVSSQGEAFAMDTNHLASLIN